MSLGLGGNGPPNAGRLGTRGESGNVVRWREGWFEEIGASVGWEVAKHDKPEILKRAELLLKIFSRPRSGLLSIVDAVRAIADV